MTHLFRDVLHGWGQILLCVNVSPAARDYDETARVLRYAALATQIGTAARADPPLRVLKCAHLSACPQYMSANNTATVLCQCVRIAVHAASNSY